MAAHVQNVGTADVTEEGVAIVGELPQGREGRAAFSGLMQYLQPVVNWVSLNPVTLNKGGACSRYGRANYARKKGTIANIDSL